MDLTKKDRLLLYNQLEILKYLNPDDCDTYELEQKILVDGYKHNYNELIEGFSDELDESVSKYVFDVFQMYRSLNNSYLKLSKEDKLEIDIYDIKFQGYDGNEEVNHYAYAKFVLEDLKRYAEIYDNGNVEFNSHTNKLSDYSRMIQIWKSISGRYNDLSLCQIKKIIK